MNAETAHFITENRDKDIHQLSLQRNINPQVNLAFALRQIAGKQKVKHKIPTIYNTDDILYPAKLPLEQSSSEITALYKSTLCEGNTLADLTGGFGVDTFFLSSNFQHVTYIERQTELCELAEHNFKALGHNNITIVNAQSEDYLQTMQVVDWIYIDPARRSSVGKKVVLLSDCEPNVAETSTTLLDKATKVMIKLSPMMDISAALKELPNCTEIHILAVENECKELLLILDKSESKNCSIKTVNFAKNDKMQSFNFSLEDENSALPVYTQELKKYLYEPNAALMKSGAFKVISTNYSLYKLHTSTHLYTSNELILQFPGRTFEVLKWWGNSKQDLRDLTTSHPKANITVRNYPLSVEELRKKLKIKDGGDVYLFATTLANNSKVIIECTKPQ